MPSTVRLLFMYGWPAGFPVLVGACQFGTAWAGLRENSFIHQKNM